MSHVWMSHVTHVNESCHTSEWVMSHVWIKSCHTSEWVPSHVWISHVTLRLPQYPATHCNTQQHTTTHCNNHDLNESCYICEWVERHVWVMSNVWRRNVTHIKDPHVCYRHKWPMCVTDMNDSCVWQTWMTHVCDTHEWLMCVTHMNDSSVWQKWMTHVCDRCQNESCNTCQCVTRHSCESCNMS